MYVYMYFLDVGKVDIINSEVHCELQTIVHCYGKFVISGF